MPTYEYRCTGGHQYEKREGFDAPPRQKCQVCSKQANRLLSAPPIVFKGTGFYKTDSRGSSAGSESAPSTAASSSSSSESAPAETSPAPGTSSDTEAAAAS